MVLGDYGNCYIESQITCEQRNQDVEQQQEHHNLDTLTDLGGSKVDESLFLLNSPAPTINSSPAYFETPSLTPISSSVFSSSLYLPPNSVTDLFSDIETMSMVVNPSNNPCNFYAAPSCSQTCSRSSGVVPQVQPFSMDVLERFSAKQTPNYTTIPGTMLLNKSSFEPELQAYQDILTTSSEHLNPHVAPPRQTSYPESTSNHAASSQPTLLVKPKHEQLHNLTPSMASSHEPEEEVVNGQYPYLASNDFALHGIGAQAKSNGESFVGVGQENPLGLIDNCLDVLGSSDQQQQPPLFPNSLTGLEVPCDSSTIPPYHCHNVLDAYRCVPLHHGAQNDEPLYMEPKIDLISLYTHQLKDLSQQAGVEMLSDDSQHSSKVLNFRPYTKDEKNSRIDRYRRKRSERNFNKKIKYACRKTLADSRPRIKGRFAKTDDT